MLATEKIKFREGAVYDLVVNGVSFGEEEATFTFLPGEKVYEQVEADVTGCARIVVLDSLGDVMEARSGYIYLDSLAKKKDYVIGTEQVEGGQDDNGDTIYLNHDVTGTVMIAVLKKSDVRQQVDDLQDTVDMLVMESLEV